MDELMGIVAGPPCTTFNHSDASNKRKEKLWNYRDQSVNERPPQHPEGTQKGDLARSHDWIACGTFTICSELGTAYLIENPEAYLRYREFTHLLAGLRRTVHYCAYWTAEEAAEAPACKKPTNIWTNVMTWDSQGSTQNGKCNAQCQWGWRRGHYWVHHQLQDQEVVTRGRVPVKLMEEWMEAAVLWGLNSEEGIAHAPVI
jgi:hypothetical protein